MEATTGRRWRAALSLAALGALFALSRPYRGIVGDSVLYVGRGIANLDPSSVGLDPMWALDGQMRFSLFPLLVERLIVVIGPAAAAMALAALGLLLWFLGLVALTKSCGKASALGWIVIACALFPAGYNAYASIYFGEPIAAPRILAEAAVLFSLGAMIEGRAIAFGCWSVVAVALHPIMAFAGLASGLVYLCLQDRRWIFVFIASGIACAGGALLGLPVLDRLAVRIDPHWLAILRGPTDSLFPTLWPVDAWMLKTLQAATVAIGAIVAKGAERRLYVSVLIASGAALAFATLLGDVFPLLLVVQAQPWRATWLLAVTAPLAFASAATSLARPDVGSRLALASLIGAWAFHGTEIGAVLALAALFGARARGNFVARLGPTLQGGLLLAAPILVTTRLTLDATAIFSYASTFPEKARPPLLLLALDAHAFAGCAALAIVMGAASSRVAPRSRLAISGQAVFCVFALFFWRQDWEPYRRALQKEAPQSVLVAQLKARAGAVLWIGGNQEAWYWAQRPNWAAGVQGNGIVFSRELSLLWFERMKLLRDLDWIGDGGLTPRRESRPDPAYPEISADRLRRLCARADAPAWVLAPTEDEIAPPAGFVWKAPVRRYVFDPRSGKWAGVDKYAVRPCSPTSAAPSASDR